ncbi:Zn(II)2Cys6 transcription factor domain-containing protein [Aspergillus candidus]|uniref:Zn(2)-C6 fungal-type domain-containing protein n=1 Tax=Aspergillus candidus TaxID=41067 RepID=A0A2I2FIC6_ASPCN|nr:hypothetical protein BDW47DRAFT_94742 [Aspergillus candidus]PLB40370.1 hypothetical protein BDW47DRAFT_94742 [Aspergillus candidus]
MSAANDNYTIHKVSLKRTRQACGPCRRKKARCPGEKPTCSLCQRLGQNCSYGLQALNRVGTRSSTSHGPARSEARDADCPSSHRIQRIEDRLEEMTHLLQYLLHHTVGD